MTHYREMPGTDREMLYREMREREERERRRREAARKARKVKRDGAEIVRAMYAAGH